VYKNVSELGRFLLSFEQMVHCWTGGGDGGAGGCGQFEPMKSFFVTVVPNGYEQHPKVVVLHGQLVPQLLDLVIWLLPQHPKVVEPHGQFVPTLFNFGVFVLVQHPKTPHGLGQLDPVKSDLASVEPAGYEQHPKVVVLHGQLEPQLSVLVIWLLPQHPNVVELHGQLDPKASFFGMFVLVQHPKTPHGLKGGLGGPATGHEPPPSTVSGP
jgi:hypothetical protein